MTREPTLLFCVGATKAGTTWLFDHLAAHPECHLRSIKELHYFDAADSRTWSRQIKVQRALADKLAARAAVARGESRARVAQKQRDVAEWLAILQKRAEDIPAYLGYLTGGRRGQSVVGDITPAYAMLSEDRLRAMAGMAVDVRFVYLLRDPLARLWSHVRMIASRASSSADAVPQAAFALMERVLAGEPSAAVTRGDYTGTLAKLGRAVDPKRLLVLFQEELLSAPGLARLCRFLGISAQSADFGRVVHEGVALAMTEDHRVRALAMLRPQYEGVARQFPALPDAWVRNMDAGKMGKGVL